MARIKIQLPDEAIFSTELDIRIDDINYGGHLANDKILSYFHEIRIRFFESIAQSELDFDGKGLIMSDSAIVYKSQAFQGEKLEAKLFATELGEYSFDLLYLLTSLKTQKEVARGKTGLVFFDYEIQKISKSPIKLQEILGLK